MHIIYYRQKSGMNAYDARMQSDIKTQQRVRNLQKARKHSRSFTWLKCESGAAFDFLLLFFVLENVLKGWLCFGGHIMSKFVLQCITNDDYFRIKYIPTIIIIFGCVSGRCVCVCIGSGWRASLAKCFGFSEILCDLLATIAFMVFHVYRVSMGRPSMWFIEYQEPFFLIEPFSTAYVFILLLRNRIKTLSLVSFYFSLFHFMHVVVCVRNALTGPFLIKIDNTHTHFRCMYTVWTECRIFLVSKHNLTKW